MTKVDKDNFIKDEQWQQSLMMLMLSSWFCQQFTYFFGGVICGDEPRLYSYFENFDVFSKFRE
jgi:hypothetical protein